MKCIPPFFKSGANHPDPEKDAEAIRREYKRHQLRIFISLTIGYGMFYVCRLSLSVMKKPLIDQGILTVDELGRVGAALFFTYGIGKLVNGFISDWVNVRKFISVGLLASALINISLGMTSAFWAFLILWGINGWFQSMGAAPCVVSLSQWFPKSRRGSFYGWWSTSHNIGEAITFIMTAVVVQYLGWRFGFYMAGGLCVLAAGCLYLLLSDRPETLGLPNVESSDDLSEPENKPACTKNIKALQVAVFKNPAVWIIGLASALMYVSRYAVQGWAILFMQETKGYDLMKASSTLAFFSFAGIAGSIFSGWISDRLFNSKRGIPTFLFGLMQLGAMILLFVFPGSYTQDCIAMTLFGVGTGGLLVFLGGLIAVDLADKQAAGAAMGFIGVFSYMGASFQEFFTGNLLENGKTITGTLENGAPMYQHHFTPAILFWIGCSAASMILTASYFIYHKHIKKP